MLAAHAQQETVRLGTDLAAVLAITWKRGRETQRDVGQSCRGTVRGQFYQGDSSHRGTVLVGLCGDSLLRPD